RGAVAGMLGMLSTGVRYSCSLLRGPAGSAFRGWQRLSVAAFCAPLNRIAIDCILVETPTTGSALEFHICSMKTIPVDERATATANWHAAQRD
ncbi:MAG: hypothetical protein V3V71_06475, partial [Roseateles sp.]